MEHFRRGVNMGNMLEAPNEGDWGVTFDPNYFVLIKQRGFDFVRLPVAWSEHTIINNAGEFVGINQTFADRVKYIVNEAVKNDLGIIIDFHNFAEMNTDPAGNIDTLLKIWQTIAETYKDYPSNVVFEILNEPNTALTTQVWNEYQNECIQVIRKSNPTRKIVVTAGDWGGYGGLLNSVLPKDDNLIASFHDYDPFNFTHQGADWTGSDMTQYLGTQWTGSDAEKKVIDNTFKNIKAWSDASGIPVIMGEFGAYSMADMDSRVRWTTCMRETAEYYGFAWSYWEFCSGFGIYDPQAEQFRDGLADALTGTPIDPSTYGTGKGMPQVVSIAGQSGTQAGYIGPFKYNRAINIICDSWTNMTLYDTDRGTEVIELGDNVPDWAQAFIVFDGLTDTGGGFSKTTCELTVRNIDNSITDIGFNLDNNGPTDSYTETGLAQFVGKQLTANSSTVIQNADGTTTFIFNLQKAYGALKGKCDNGIRLKMFIESVPDRKANYDRKGSLEFISVVLK